MKRANCRGLLTVMRNFNEVAEQAALGLVSEGITTLSTNSFTNDNQLSFYQNAAVFSRLAGTSSMPMPQTYFHASREFDAFIQDVRDTCMLQTHHQAYHTLRAVLHTFRSHLTTRQALEFANALPAVTRSIFVEDWTPQETPSAFPDRQSLIREVKSVRKDHNLAPDSAIDDVSAALRRSSIDENELDRVLSKLPSGAQKFWAVPD